ncbi:ribose-phosphate diphosphokinase [Microbulbifer hydrolyticus]|uniref:ribose-phosphate diphosphokinase n=1 Tax=Microbulbifer hydrolyticus TaxID=48074 RepID=A0AA89PFV1_9GAMM|nr:ribose-phosphate diphosphokinase [Microbulbifer hydrolyticus]MBB5213155.1 ribose-phosphate pyrophosphokinase [Microbulbifer hydrolyticus]
MSAPLLFSLAATLPLSAPLGKGIHAVHGELEMRHFPDGESYLRVRSPVHERHCVLLANLSQPDEKLLPLLFLAHTLRALGAASIGLVAPYLCYMRQDKAFQPGEAVTSRIFAGLISDAVNWLLTVDPHLHRYHSLAEIYSIPAHALSGMPAMQTWIEAQPEEFLLVGPDAESQQWVSALAHATGRPYIVGKKQRHGDRSVTVTLPEDAQIRRSAVLIVDDVISSGHTVLETTAALKRAGAGSIVCAAVHGVFAEDADRKILQAGADRLATSNSIPGQYGAFDLSPVLIPAVKALLREHRGGAPEKGDYPE